LPGINVLAYFEKTREKVLYERPKDDETQDTLTVE
jgi:hypothetical protein